eukprot:8123825-Lingulodinium_polyedra.AAC.1
MSGGRSSGPGSSSSACRVVAGTRSSSCWDPCGSSPGMKQGSAGPFPTWYFFKVALTFFRCPADAQWAQPLPWTP